MPALCMHLRRITVWVLGTLTATVSGPMRGNCEQGQDNMPDGRRACLCGGP